MKAARRMMSVSLRGALFTLGAAALVSGCLGGKGGGLFGGADPRDFTTADVNGDASIAREEFSRWGRDQGLLAAYLGEGDKTVSETALATGLYEIWNLEGSDLTEGEWNEGMQAWFPDQKDETFAAWDLDANGKLDEQEMIAGLAHADLLKSFDEDGNGEIAPGELLSSFYQVFDIDQDEKLTMDEWTGGLGRWTWPI